MKYAMLAAAAALLPAAAEASPATCLIEVAGKTYVRGVCNVSGQLDDGFMCVGCVDSPKDPGRTRNFVQMSKVGDVVTATWNGPKGASTHADLELGALKFDRGCWLNETARVCVNPR